MTSVDPPSDLSPGRPTGPAVSGRSRHLVDPELLALLDALPPGGVDADNLAENRRARAELAAATPVPDDGVARERWWIPNELGEEELLVTVFTPLDVAEAVAAGATAAGLLHVHGGGYVMGSVDQYDLLAATTARLVGCVVVSVDYRLAPETPHPGPMEDCYAALVWFHEHAVELGVDPDRIGIKGESAGGGLAAATALLARDLGGPPLVLQHLLYPMLDDRTVLTEEPHPYTGEFGWTRSSNRFGWASLLGGQDRIGAPDISAYAAPGRAEDLAGLPPTILATGDLDLFLEEDLDFVRRLSRAGVPIDVQIYPGAFHAFGNAPQAAVSRRAQRDMVEALRRGFGLGPSMGTADT